MLLLSAWIVCSKPIARRAPVTTTGSVVVPALSPATRSMVRAVKAPSFFTCLSLASRRTPETTQMLVTIEGNSKVAVRWVLTTQSWISFVMMLPMSIGSPQTMTYNKTNLSWETVVVWVVGISLDFRNFTHTLAIGFKSILLTTRPSSLAHDAPSIVRVVKMVFHFFGVNLSRNLAYSQLISAGKL